jgi:hypothetical protein
MSLDESQRKTVAEWVKQGLKISEVQSRLASELGVTMTYMDVRFLIDDLKLTPKDAEPPKPQATLVTPNAVGTAPATATKGAVVNEPAAVPAGPGQVSVSVDQLARPGAVVSGKVTFSDGNRAQWYLDQMGRLGLSPEQTGYRPPAADVQEFQAALETELAKMGF